MKLGIIMANFGRQSILEICFAGIDRLRWDMNMDIPVVCAGEEDDATISLCRHYDINHIWETNRPLTGKFNRACIELKGSVDYVMVIGSDNVLSTETFKKIYAKCEEGVDLIGASDIYFMCLDDVHSGKLIYFGSTTVLGVGRTVSSRVLDDINWTPWGVQKDRGIDRVMLDTVRPHVKTRILLEGCHVFDLKTSNNLNNVNSWAKAKGYMPSADLFWDNISPAEKELVINYLKS